MLVSGYTEQLALLFSLELVTITFASGENESFADVCLIVVPVARKHTSTLSFLLLFLANF